MTQQQSLGVVIGRFQTPDLHHGHRHLISHAVSQHESVLVLIGDRIAQPTEHDPLDFVTRRLMVHESYPEVEVMQIHDHPSDDEWSRNVDRIVSATFPDHVATLYGSRKSFASSYTGGLTCTEIDEVDAPPATALRNGIDHEQYDGTSFRAGAIYAAVEQYHPTSYQAVDVAVVHSLEPKVLVGRKEGNTKWQFIGGFVDPTDRSLEAAAKREVIEETGHIEVDDFNYIASMPIDDYRYRGTRDGIMTAFFKATYIFGAPRATDDVMEIRWQSFDGLIDCLTPNHKQLGKKLLEHMHHTN